MCLPDTYGDLLDSEWFIKTYKTELMLAGQMRDQLYAYRFGFHVTDDKGYDEDVEYKVGLHGFERDGEIYVASWLMPLFRYFVLNNTETDYEHVEKKEGSVTQYHSLMKREVKIAFDKVKDVTLFYPLGSAETEEKIIYDEFLKELESRRADSEFRNIVFSIQKKQSEIVQLPFRQNLIVQGCAGSGKSMIMLHRLPILLYDNPRTLQRSGIYIVSPSKAYIQMAQQMRHELEISDLNMGTMNDYYDELIARYHHNPREYGEIDWKAEEETCFYSEECAAEITGYIETKIQQYDVNCFEEQKLFGLRQRNARSALPADRTNLYLLEIGDVLTENRKSLQQYHYAFSALLSAVQDIASVYSNRQENVLRGYRKRHSEIESRINEISDPSYLEQIKDDNQIHEVEREKETLRKRIAKIDQQMAEVPGNRVYFSILNAISESCLLFWKNWHEYDKPAGEAILADSYSVIDKRSQCLKEAQKLIDSMSYVQDPYAEYDQSLIRAQNRIRDAVQQYNTLNAAYISPVRADQLTEQENYYQKLSQEIVATAYDTIMQKSEKYKKTREKARKKTALPASPYIYLRILYTWQGAPNAAREALIAIDEAQNITRQELLLIKAINGDSVVFNLYGDYRQHIPGTKGIENWNDLADIASFRIEEMNENYRNARQITRYCNGKFHMNMREISLSGSGVYETASAAECANSLENYFYHAKESGNCAVIVKDKDAAQRVMGRFADMASNIYDMTSEDGQIKGNRWNLITVKQAKGLEFKKVYVFAHGMSDNEKYIAYTRALDELHLTEGEVDFPLPDSHGDVGKGSSKAGSSVTGSSIHPVKKSVDSGSSSKHGTAVADYFQKQGLEVIDARDKGGYLWVIGEKCDIDKYVMHAVDQFGISGGYSQGKATKFRTGWYTKTKK